MIKIIIKRLLISVVIILGLLTLTFIVIHIAPGDPTSIYLSPNITPEVAEQMKVNLGLDEPIYIQYFKWLGVIYPFNGFIEGNFGHSFSRHKPVMEIIGKAIPNTLLLTVSAFILNLFLGVVLGIISARKKNSGLDKVISTGSIILYSMPEFWFSLILIFIFSANLGWLPSSQMNTIGAESLPFWAWFLDTLKHLLMPLFVLGICSAASTIRYMRSSVLDIMDKQYVFFARMKGLSEKEIFKNHILKNSLIPIVTLFGLYFPFLLGSSAIVEYIFAWPGLGRVAIDSIFTRDYPLIIGITFISGLLVIIGNLISDILNIWIDPRLR